MVTGPSFSPEVVAAVCRHMNDDHAEGSLLICRTLAGAPDALSARAVDVDSTGMRFAVTGPDGAGREVLVPFPEPVSERAQIRLAVVALHDNACRAAGLAPRGDA